MKTRRRLSVVAVALLLPGCAVARWQVPAEPRLGQDEAQVELDRRECDDAAKASSGYSRAAEAKAWLWGVFVVAPAAVVSVAVDQATLSTTPVLKATTDAVKGVRPAGNPDFKTYFAEYRACMIGRGYAVR